MIEPSSPVQWAKVIDHTRCIGCHACTTACKSENVVPLSVTRTYVKHVDVGVFPQARRAHQVTRCNQCAHASMRNGMPDYSNVQTCGRDRRLRQVDLHRLQSMHGGMSLRCHLHQPRRSFCRRNVTSAPIESTLDWNQHALSFVQPRRF